MCVPITTDRSWYLGKKKAPLFEGMGELHFPISTKNELVQKYVNQGLVLAYGFNHAEAARSFYYATKLDPNCAMAFWGYAYVLGPNYNAGMDTDTGDLKIPTEEVKEIYWKNRKYRVIKDSFENRVEKFEVLVEGEVSLLYNSTNAKVIYARDRVQMNGKLYLIDKHHFSDKIWDMLSKCPVFEEKYSAYYNEHKDKKLFRRNRKAVEKWTEMIRYYNAHCGKETTAI